MARLRSGILGQLRGKVAGVVGSQWKDKNYIREYVLPANPNTAAQQTQRTKMADCVEFCKPLVGPVFNAYTDRFQKSMSGFNRFIKSNIAVFDGAPDFMGILLTEGKLSNVAITTSKYDTGTGDNIFVFTTNYQNNGAATDKVYAAVYDESTNTWFFAAAEVARSTLTITVPCDTGLTFTDLESWIWCAKYSNTLVAMLSDSKWGNVTEGP